MASARKLRERNHDRTPTATPQRPAVSSPDYHNLASSSSLLSPLVSPSRSRLQVRMSPALETSLKRVEKEHGRKRLGLPAASPLPMTTRSKGSARKESKLEKVAESEQPKSESTFAQPAPVKSRLPVLGGGVAEDSTALQRTDISGIRSRLRAIRNGVSAQPTESSAPLVSTLSSPVKAGTKRGRSSMLPSDTPNKGENAENPSVHKKAKSVAPVETSHFATLAKARVERMRAETTSRLALRPVTNAGN